MSLIRTLQVGRVQAELMVHITALISMQGEEINVPVSLIIVVVCYNHLHLNDLFFPEYTI